MLIRPLLCLTRAEIERYCAEKGFKPYTDSSNLETDYRRNKIRLELIPHLEERYNPKIRDSLASLAELAAEDRLLLGNIARKRYLDSVTVMPGESIADKKKLKELPSAILGRVMHIALSRFVSPRSISRIHIEQLKKLILEGRTGQELSLPGGVRAAASYDRLHLMRPGQDGKVFHSSDNIELVIPGKTLIPGAGIIHSRLFEPHELIWPLDERQAFLDYGKLAGNKLSVRFRRPGDRFYPHGSAGSKKLKDFLIDQKVPRQIRELLPLVIADGEIIWVAGIRIAEQYKVTGASDKILRLAYQPFVKRDHQAVQYND